MSLGAIAAVLLARLVDLAARPGRSPAMGVAYHALILVTVLVLSGVPATLVPGLDAHGLQVAQVLVCPLACAVSSFWVRGWLRAEQRDRLMSGTLFGTALLLPVGAVAALALPQAQQLPAAAALSLLGSSVTLWLVVRAWLMGDRLAPFMALACALTVPAVGGLYAAAVQLDGAALWVDVIAGACCAAANGVAGYALWRRDQQHWMMREAAGAGPVHVDPVTRLHSGIGLVRKLVGAERRRRRTGRDGAVLALMVFGLDKLAGQVGTAGVNEFMITLASRIQRQVGVVNPVGRYYDNCFVTLVETIQSPAWLRTLGLRVASAARKPIEVRSLSGERVEVRAEIGVGVVHLPPGAGAVEQVLHDAQDMALAARAMRSRAAIRDPASGKAVPVEQAQLGPRRQRHGRPAEAPEATRAGRLVGRLRPGA